MSIDSSTTSVALILSSHSSFAAAQTRQALSLVFTFAYVWSLGGNLHHASQDEFDDFVREQLQPVMNLPGAR